MLIARLLHSRNGRFLMMLGRAAARKMGELQSCGSCRCVWDKSGDIYALSKVILSENKTEEYTNSCA